MLCVLFAKEVFSHKLLCTNSSSFEHQWGKGTEVYLLGVNCSFMPYSCADVNPCTTPTPPFAGNYQLLSVPLSVLSLYLMIHMENIKFWT